MDETINDRIKCAEAENEMLKAEVRRCSDMVHFGHAEMILRNESDKILKEKLNEIETLKAELARHKDMLINERHRHNHKVKRLAEMARFNERECWNCIFSDHLVTFPCAPSEGTIKIKDFIVCHAPGINEDEYYFETDHYCKKWKQKEGEK